MWSNKDLARARDAAYAEQSAERVTMDVQHEHEWQIMDAARTRILHSMRRANDLDYDAWLTKHLEIGGRPTHFYDYPMSQRDFYVALSDVTLAPLYGAMSISVIVPEGIVVDGAPGHIDVYRMEDGSAGRFGVVPVFNDTRLIEIEASLS